MAAALLTLALATLVFLAAQEMFGTAAAFIALALLVFDPNLLAHGAVVGTDIGLSCFMFAAIYAFYRYVKVPSTWRLLIVGLATGLALASKHTATPSFPCCSCWLSAKLSVAVRTPSRAWALCPGKAGLTSCHCARGRKRDCHHGTLGLLWFSLPGARARPAVESAAGGIRPQSLPAT